MSSLTLPLEFANDGVEKGVLGRNVSPSNRHDVLFQWDQKVQQVPLQLLFIYKSAKYIDSTALIHAHRLFVYTSST